MPAKKYRVTLTTEERAELTALVNKRKGAAGKLKRARILLLADKLIELEVVETVSYETVRTTLKK